MHALRRHLRTWTTIWLFVQLLSLGGLMPAACCAAHADGADDDQCADDCPMHRPAPAEECPLHSGVASGDHAAGPVRAAGDCVIGGLCHVPSAALAVLLGSPAVLPSAVTLAALSAAGGPVVRPSSLPSLDPALDVPPPRA